MEFQNTKRVLKAVYNHSASDSSTDEHHKMLHVMYGGSSNITSMCVVKTLHRAVFVPTPNLAPHHKWMETPIGFDTSDYPKNMVKAGLLPLLVPTTIGNVRLYHILVDGGAAPILISLAAYEKLWIPMSRLAPSCPFSGLGPGSIIQCSSISLPMTFGTPENYCMESVVFNITGVNLPFNSILDQLALYQFMAVAHYGYLVLKMSSPKGVIKVRGDCSTSVSILEKLQVLEVEQEAVVSYGGQDQAPSSSCQCGSTLAPQPSGNEGVPKKVIQISTGTTQTTHS
jgi:hypothetical protein